MKKISKILILATAPLLLLPSCYEVELLKNGIQRNEAVEQTSIPTTIRNGVIDFFASDKNIQFSSTKTYGYSSDTSYVVDAVSSSTRVNKINDKDGNTKSETYYVKNGQYAQRQYLDMTNSIRTEDTTISFDTLTGNPLSFLTSENIDKCFVSSQTDGGYVLTPTPYGSSKLSTSFNSFFPSDDTYTYDQRTLSEYVSDFELNVTEAGVPTSMTFTKVKKDMFGAVREYYTTTLEQLDEVKSLQKITPFTTGDAYTRVQTALNNLKTNMADANFTQSISTDMWSYDSNYDIGYMSVSYKSYYQFDNAYSLMVSDLALQEETYGKTYVGVVMDSSGNYEWVGISPDHSYMSALSDDDDSYDEYTQFVPSIGKVSPDFFSYDEGKNSYTFDIDGMIMADHSFQLELLTSLVGGADYLAMKYGNYIGSINTMKFDFDNLVVNLDASNEVKNIVLNYNGMDGSLHSTTVSFSNFGTTDISKVDGLADVYKTIKANV